jgi:hypothetical protein
MIGRKSAILRPICMLLRQSHSGDKGFPYYWIMVAPRTKVAPDYHVLIQKQKNPT